MAEILQKRKRSKE